MISKDLNPTIEADVVAIGRISIVPSLLDVVCRTTGMGFAAIARVTEDKWIACGIHDEISFGLVPGGELELETTICNEIRQHHEPVVIDHVEKDETFCQHHTPLQYGFQSYISFSIFRKDGRFFGTLCAIDPKPAKLKNPETIGMFRLFAELISFHLNAIEDLSLSEAKLLEQKKIAEVREQFIAILGHDLRNPLQAVMMGAEILSHSSTDANSVAVVKTIKNSSYRMSLLVENILDFARGNLGGGITLKRAETHRLDETLNVVIAELKTIWPDRIIETNYDLNVPINCDTNRLAQLFSNLIGNVIIHGKADTPVKVNASSNTAFNLSIINYGDPIPQTALDRLFQPFYRGEDKSGKKGLGLGLYIAHEIAKAHNGEIKVTSTDAETCFTLTLPVTDNKN